MPHIAKEPWPSLMASTHEIQKYVDDQLNAGILASTIRRNLINPLRHIINKFASRRRPVRINLPDPFREIIIPDNPEPRDWVLSNKEKLQLYVAIVEGCRGRQQKLLWFALVKIALNTGLRRIQLLNLQWRCVDFEGRAILVLPAKREKKARFVPLSNETCWFLKKYHDELPEENRRPASLVFPITGTAHEQAWKRIVKRAGLLKTKDDPLVIQRASVNAKAYYFCFHDLRHTAATDMRSKKIGLTADETDYMLGHIDKRMSARYEHIWDFLVDDIRDKLNRAEEAEPEFDEKGEMKLMAPEEIARLKLFETEQPYPLGVVFQPEAEAWEKTKNALWQWE
jgi:integrase